MRLETRQSLTDALQAAEEVVRVTDTGWEEDRILALAVERLLMIIGEAFVRIRSSEENVLSEIADAYKVIGMRTSSYTATTRSTHLAFKMQSNVACLH